MLFATNLPASPIFKGGFVAIDNKKPVIQVFIIKDQFMEYGNSLTTLAHHV